MIAGSLITDDIVIVDFPQRNGTLGDKFTRRYAGGMPALPFGVSDRPTRNYARLAQLVAEL